jgi:uncharacterized RDD family membrane protein YckC
MRFLKLVFFNGLSKAILKFDFGGTDNKAPDRVKAFLVEGLYNFISFIPFIILAVFLVKISQQLLAGQLGEMGVQLLNLIIFFPLYGLVITIFSKDFFNGQSIVNRLWGYQVIDIKTGTPPTPFKCMLRNLTLPLIPFELLFTLVNPERRIGDLIAGTKLVKVDKTDPEFILKEIESKGFGQSSKLALTIPTLLFIIWTLMVSTAE